MAARNNTLLFEITGDESGLIRSLKHSSNSIFEFGNSAGGVFGQFSGAIADVTGKLSGFSGGLLGIVGVAGLATAGVGALVASSNEYVKTLNDLSKLSGMSVEQLQKLNSAFYTTGLNIDQIANANKDALDKWGDAIRNGGGVSDDAKELGLNLKNYSANLNRVDGGIRNIIQSYYELKKLGKSRAEIVNFLETQGSDASALMPVLAQFRTENEAMNHVMGQTASITTETAKKYQEFDANVNQLQTSLKGLTVKGLTPVISGINALFEAGNQKPHEAGLFEDLNERIKNTKGSLQDMLDIWQKLRLAGALNYNGAALNTGTMDNGKQSKAANLRDSLKGKMYTLQSDVEGAILPPVKGDFTDKEKTETDAKNAAAKAEAEAAKAAAKAEAARKALEAKRIQAQKVLDQTFATLGANAASVQIQQFNKTQDDIELRIRESAKVLNKSESETTALLAEQYTNRKRLFKEMVDSMLLESDPKKLAQNIAAIGSTGISQEQANKLLADQNERTGINQTNEYLSFNADPRESQNLNTDLSNELALAEQLHNAKFLGEEAYQQRVLALQTEYANKQAILQTDAITKTMGLWSTSANNLGSVLAGAFGESTAAAKIAFGVSKGIAIANSIINIQQGVSKAISLGWPQGIAAGLQVVSEGAKIVNTIKGTNIQGQAHDGWDSLPSTGTYNLEKGERVVGKSLNQDLTNYLNKNNSSTEQGDITINAPLIVNGAGNLDDSKFQDLCKRHAETILQVVRNNQKRNT